MLGGKNKQQHRPLGYTIVEVMIVLAVSGMMFVIAANFINGKQERAAFTEGSNDTGSLMQGIVEDITDGHYSDVPINCSVPDGATSLSFPPSPPPEQGANPDCVFLGKIVRFSAQGAIAAPNSTNYSVYSLAAARSVTSINPPSPLVGAITGGAADLTTTSVISQSLQVKSMTIVDALGHPLVNPNTVYNIGFAQGLGNSAGGGDYVSGAQQPVQLIYYDNTDSPGANAGTNIRPAKKATICLTDGTRYAQVLIGGALSGGGASSNNNNQLSIGVQQLGTTPC